MLITNMHSTSIEEQSVGSTEHVHHVPLKFNRLNPA